MASRRNAAADARPLPPLPAGFAAQVVAWQRAQGRHHLPWQATQDPYRVWLSEIMLQQTQVSTVLGYFERFLDRFPTVVDLARAPSEDVMALWSGLGYYARARNLHRCAQVVDQVHGGQFPRTAAELAELPGIGRSTAAAIAAFCFAEHVAILDGNVKRVLSRVLGFDEDLAQQAAERRLWALAEALLPTAAEGPGAIERYTQGMMDLGATLCTTRRPACDACPVRAGCVAGAAGNPEQHPVKTRKLKRGRRRNALLWLQQGDQVWLRQRPATGVWAQLWTLPLFDDAAALEATVAPWVGNLEWLPPFTHVLTHLDWELQPARLQLLAPPDAALQAAIDAGTRAVPPAEAGGAGDAALTVAGAEPAGRWVPLAALDGVGLPAPVRKLLG